MMQHKDFYVGKEFWTATGKWRVTDLGQRTIIAIQIIRQGWEIEEHWFAGPPYAVKEYVFDENDMPGCWATKEEHDARKT